MKVYIGNTGHNTPITILRVVTIFVPPQPASIASLRFAVYEANAQTVSDLGSQFSYRYLGLK